MLQLARGLGLRHEFGPVLLLLRHPGTDHLHRHLAHEVAVRDEHHLAHPAPANAPLDVVLLRGGGELAWLRLGRRRGPLPADHHYYALRTETAKVVHWTASPEAWLNHRETRMWGAQWTQPSEPHGRRLRYRLHEEV